MFSDLTRKVTMQNLYHDGGFSSMGMSLRAMATYQKGLEEYMDENGNIIYGYPPHRRDNKNVRTPEANPLPGF